MYTVSLCTLSHCVLLSLTLFFYSVIEKSDTSTSSLTGVLEELPREGIWSPLLEDWAISIASREDKVIKKPFMMTTGSKPTRPTDPSSGGNREVTETDLYLLGAIEKLVYRVDFMEKRLRRTEELLYYVMASKNKNEGKSYYILYSLESCSIVYYFMHAFSFKSATRWNHRRSQTTSILYLQKFFGIVSHFGGFRKCRNYIELSK